MKNKGFTLLEVIIAILLVLVGLTGTFVLITKTMGVMAVSSSRFIAAYLSQEGIEIVRNIRDTNWLEGAPSWDDGLVFILCPFPPCPFRAEADYNDSDLTFIGSPSFLKFDGGFYNYTSGVDTKFKRKITIVPEDIDGDTVNDILKVTVLVEWTEKGKSYSHTAQENLYNWR